MEERVSNWPKLFFESITKEKNEKLIKILSKADIYWWRAYNIYDDILDGDSGPNKLPIANIYLINFLKSYYKLKLSREFYKIFHEIIFQVEKANEKELTEKKIKFKNGEMIIPQNIQTFYDLKLISNKSLALSLGPVAIMFFLNFNQKKISSCVNFFRNFLAAKQLSDDAYDWLDDLLNGKITAANVLILQDAEKNNLRLNYEKKPEILLKIFLKINRIIAKKVLKLCEQANLEADKIGLERGCKFIKETIVPLEICAKRALKI